MDIDKIRYIGNYEFEIELNDGTIKNCGKNLRNMIGYCYFESKNEPPSGWEMDYIQFHKDYFTKVEKDIKNGNIDL